MLASNFGGIAIPQTAPQYMKYFLRDSVKGPRDKEFAIRASKIIFMHRKSGNKFNRQSYCFVHRYLKPSLVPRPLCLPEYALIKYTGAELLRGLAQNVLFWL